MKLKPWVPLKGLYGCIRCRVQAADKRERKRKWIQAKHSSFEGLCTVEA